MTQDELITQITQEIKGLSSSFVAADYTNAVDTAERETGFTLPATSTTQLFWLGERAKRHLIHMLLFSTALKFKVKQINLNQKFEHLLALVKEMDARWDLAQKDPTTLLDGYTYEIFGTKIDAGFAYDDVGQDITYNDEQLVTLTPSSESNVE